ncbi:DUF4340 domain-containing protein [Planctomyces sp. SH-PL62]|uniref:DUF4340 domain-containing protein n=1 Tax=Planctomyces sp. SH-PL62 TaxID=1636152 RepID=UPI00078C8082|nr:DUF4340 domain-containing protein [Planctomyces sp. SH-PL62]AMV37121.1 hypothetical protein VT85_06795 [Planctomyces sp. SH-PL62]
MTEISKTGIFAAVALAFASLAMVATRDRTVRSEAFNDQGQPFFADFQDPLACTNLEVVDFDPSTATASRFQVKFENNKWVIPSHYGYPADARDRLSKTAAALMDLTKDTIRSDSPDDQEAMGVIDPLDAKASALKGRGKRITLRDASDKVLADFIIGEPIKDRSGQFYVRVPDQKRIYGVNLKAEPSTRFADWIETNLLKLDAAKIRKVEFDNYKVNLEQGYQKGEVLDVERKNATDPWTLTGGLPDDKQLDDDKLRALTTALADLKIVGVRAKPAGLTRDLKKTDDKGITLSAATVASLQSKGFYMTRDGQLLSNQGDVRIFTEDGVVYTLRFGEVTFGSGDELTAGTPDDAEKKADPSKAEEKKAEGSTENRFVMVTVSFDPALIPAPQAEEKPAAGELPDQVIAPDPEAAKAEEEKKAREKAAYEKKLADGKKQAEELTERFAAWYYVTPGDSFRSINLDRAALVVPKKPKAEGAPAGFPGAGGFPGGPGGPAASRAVSPAAGRPRIPTPTDRRRSTRPPAPNHSASGGL